jgi:uncharacterized protein (TIGR02246 family)
MRVCILLSLFSVLFLAGCAPQAPPVNLEAERAALAAADQAWSQTVPDVEKFVSFFAEGGTMLTPDAPIAEGQEAIRAAATSMFALPGFGLSWKNTKADVAASGDLGYTVGTYEMTMNDAAGQPSTMAGKYLTVWKKQADGQWKVVVDAPNANAPATPPAPAAAPAAK